MEKFITLKNKKTKFSSWKPFLFVTSGRKCLVLDTLVHLQLLMNEKQSAYLYKVKVTVWKRKSSGGCVHAASLRSRCGNYTDCIYFSRPAKTLAALFVARLQHQSVGLQFPRCHCCCHSLQTHHWKQTHLRKVNLLDVMISVRTIGFSQEICVKPHFVLVFFFLSLLVEVYTTVLSIQIC